MFNWLITVLHTWQEPCGSLVCVYLKLLLSLSIVLLLRDVLANRILTTSRLTLLGRGTSPTEISAAVKFILSQPALTGQMIVLDGGQHLVWQTPDITEVNE